MDIICPQKKCTACGACMNVCPKGAISLQPVGPLKHMYPVIDATKCIDCNLCVKTCPANFPNDLQEPSAAYAAVSKDYDDLMSSSSGGASSVIASEILRQGGIVYGCVQENYRDIRHRRITSASEAHKLKGSKYVQSNIGFIYRDVLADLKKGLPVLFTGTPCQIAGLRAFLRKDYENLYLVDLVCHGVPSQHLLRENVEDMIGSHNNAAVVYFRRKGEPLARMYGVFIERVSDIPENKQIFLKNDYITAFMNGLTFRDCCYSCQYARRKRVSDITIADYWGIGKTTIKTDCGISLLLQNTERGAKLINAIHPHCHIEKRSVEEAIRGNGQLIQASDLPSNREAFLSDYSKIGSRAYRKHLRLYRRYYKNTYLTRYWNRIKSLLKQIPGLYSLYLNLTKH